MKCDKSQKEILSNFSTSTLENKKIKEFNFDPTSRQADRQFPD